MLDEVLLKAHSLSLDVNVFLVMPIFKNLSQMYLFSVLVFCFIHVCVSNSCGGQKRVSDPLELELRMVAGNCTQVLCKSNKS